MRMSVIGALILAGVLVGCEEASTGTPAGTTPPADTTPPAQSATISNVQVASGSIMFDISNPNEEAVNVTVAVTPAPPEAARIVVDGTPTALAEAVIALAANGAKEGIELTMLTNELTYTITLTTADSSGNQQGQKLSATAIPRAAPPINPPANITLTPGYREVTLRWDAVEGARQYHIYRVTGIGGRFNRDETPHAVVALEVGAATQTYVDTTNLADNGIYKYRLGTVDQSDRVGSLSTELSVQVAPAVPKDLVAQGSNNAVELKWQLSAGADSYRIYRAVGNDIDTAEQIATNPVKLSPVTSNYTDNTATNGATYTYAVRAVNANGVESGNSNTITATPLAVPGTPENLTATPGNGAVMLEWQAPASSDSAVSGYRIYRAIGANIASAVPLSTAPSTLPHTARSYNDQSVTNNVQYTYIVRAVNANDTESAASDSDSATPRAPAGVPDSLNATAAVGSVSLKWGAPADGGSVTEYRIYRVAGTDIDSATRLTTIPRVLSPRAFAYTDNTATNGATYTYAVRAVNANGVESGNSNTITATPLAVPGTPENLTATPGNGSVMLAWQAPASSDSSVSGYRIYRAIGANIASAVPLSTAPPTLPHTARSYNDQSVTNNVQYTYIVRAVNANDTESAASDSDSATPRAPAGVPDSLSATAAVGSVSLKWAAPADGGTVTEYRIYRVAGTDIDSATRLTTIPRVLSPRAFAYTDNTATNNTEYTYAVRAVNANGVESGNSNTITATPLAVPGTPENLTATPGNGAVMLAWEAPASSDSAVSGYRIYRAIGANIASAMPLSTAPSTLPHTARSYNDQSVTNNVQYTYIVRAVNANDTESAASDSDSATPRAPAGVPDSLNATAAVGSVSLKWDAPAGDGIVTEYRIYRVAGSDINTATRLTTTPRVLSPRAFAYTDNTATNGTEYTYAVRAVNANGVESGNSNTITATPLAVPGTPENLTATPGNGSVMLEWEPPASSDSAVSGYRIYRAIGANIASAMPLSTAPSTLPHTARSYDDQSVTNNVQYTYIVRAVNANDTESAASDSDSATPRAPAGVPDSLNATAAVGSVSLKWDAPAGDGIVTEYRIYRVAGTDIDSATRLTTTPSRIFTYTDNTATNGTEYTYAVRAVNANGVESGNSNTETVTPLAVPDNPTNLTAAAGDGAVTLNWTAPASGGPVAQYYIYRVAGNRIISGPIRLSPTTITGTTYTDRGLTNGVQYTYAVRAVNENDAESPNSETAIATPFAPPAAPTRFTAAAGDGVVTLRWTAPAPATDTNVAQYYIYRAEGTDINTATRLTPIDPVTNIPVVIDTTTYIDRSAENDTQYTYAVRAVNTLNAESGNSNTDVATPLTPPDAPTNLDATDGEGSVTLTWTAPASGTEVAQYYIYRVEGTDISDATRVTNTNPPMILVTTYTDTGLTDGTEYTYVVRAVNANGAESANSNTASETPRFVPRNVMAIDDGGRVMLSWSAPTGATEYYIFRTVGAGSEARLTTTPTVLTETTYIDRDVTFETTYSYRIQAIFGALSGEISDSQSVTLSVDHDHDTLIGIGTLNMLDNIRYNLAGTSYKTSDSDTGLQCGADGTTACTGYELLHDLDFAVANDYTSSTINMDWRPTAAGSVVTPENATNSGWQPIGTSGAEPFATLFEGNGRSISNLYSRNVVNTDARRTALFGQLSIAGTLRNLLIEDSNVYGGSMSDHIGIAVGRNQGTISNVAVRGGSAHGGDGADRIGGLVGWNGRGATIASSSTAAVYGDDGNDAVGGLAGYIGTGSVTASYATGTVDGGADTDSVGGLSGGNEGTIRASYATGNANSNSGIAEYAGGLVGEQEIGGTIIASYATGNADGGAGTADSTGSLTGDTVGTVIASYASGTNSNGEIIGHNGTTLPGGASTLAQLTAPVAANPPTTAAPAEWQDAASHTMGAWDFGTATQNPALRYADYDGTGGAGDVDYCASFANIPGTDTAITCGTTLLSGQR